METGWCYHVPQSTFTLKCQRNILKRRNSGVYIGIVKIKIKTCLGYSALDNKELPDLGTIKNWGLKKKKKPPWLGGQHLLKWGTLSCLGGVGYPQECAEGCWGCMRRTVWDIRNRLVRSTRLNTHPTAQSHGHGHLTGKQGKRRLGSSNGAIWQTKRLCVSPLVQVLWNYGALAYNLTNPSRYFCCCCCWEWLTKQTTPS